MATETKTDVVVTEDWKVKYASTLDDIWADKWAYFQHNFNHSQPTCVKCNHGKEGICDCVRATYMSPVPLEHVLKYIADRKGNWKTKYTQALDEMWVEKNTSKYPEYFDGKLCDKCQGRPGKCACAKVTYIDNQILVHVLEFMDRKGAELKSKYSTVIDEMWADIQGYWNQYQEICKKCTKGRSGVCECVKPEFIKNLTEQRIL